MRAIDRFVHRVINVAFILGAVMCVSFVIVGLVGLLIALFTSPADGENVWFRDEVKAYHLKAVRTERIEIVDSDGNVRIVMDVHRDKPVITFYTRDGDPAPIQAITEAGLIVGSQFDDD